jgi:hypothetical protein
VSSGPIGKVAAALAVVAAVVLLATLAAPWYAWEIEAARAVIGRGEVDAWHAWEFLDIAVALVASAAAVLMVVAATTRNVNLFRIAGVLAAATLAGVIYMMVDQYATPSLSSLETETVTLGYGAWLAAVAAGVLLAAAAIGASGKLAEHRPPASRVASSVGIAVFISGLTLAGGVLAHEVEQKQTFYTAPGPPSDHKCAQGLARVTHGNWQKGFTRSNTYALTSLYVYPPSCARLQENRPNGTISTRFVYQVRNGGTWGGCDSSNLQKNADGVPVVEAFRNYGAFPCGGNHYYRTHGFFGYLNGAQNVWYNGDWHSGDHYFG